jgi:hypothetical protein
VWEEPEPEYRRRRPEETVLYAALRDNLATLLAEVDKPRASRGAEHGASPFS